MQFFTYSIQFQQETKINDVLFSGIGQKVPFTEKQSAIIYRNTFIINTLNTVFQFTNYQKNFYPAVNWVKWRFAVECYKICISIKKTFF